MNRRIFKAVLIFVGLLGLVALIAYAPIQITVATALVAGFAWIAWNVSDLF